MNNVGKDIAPFMQLFWQERKKSLSVTANGIKYHPMIIRFCLSIVAKSPSAYDELRSSNILTLLNRRTLRDNRNAIRPKVGFNNLVIHELKDLAENLFDVQRFVVLSFKEMKVQSKLVFDKHTGELIRFLDLGDPGVNFAEFEKPGPLATHALVLFVRGLASDLKFSLAYFATDGITATQFVPLFWQAICLLEITCNLWVIATVSDGASANRKFHKLHTNLSSDDSNCVMNMYAPHRNLYLFQMLHTLLKLPGTVNSGHGKQSRYLWNEDQFLLWTHISALVHLDANCDLRLLPKLSSKHVDLTAYSIIKVNLAVQVLSATVSNVLSTYSGPESSATAKFCSMMNSFFDCLNVDAQQKIK